MTNRSLIAIITVLVLACTCTAAFAEDAHRLARSGRTLTAEEAESLEKKIMQDPRDIALRTRLLRYYVSFRQACLK